MTIEKGKPWGSIVDRPAGLREAPDDAAVTAALTDGTGLPVAVAGGDLHRTIGARDPRGAAQLLELPIDLLQVTLDDQPARYACAHVLVQSPLSRGGWWRGDVVMVMNAEFVGEWHVVARGHPNDGRAEVCSWGADFGFRPRWAARRRLPRNEHVPHPRIVTGSIRTQVWEFGQPMRVSVDGADAGRARRIAVVVEPDAAIVYA